MATRKSATVTLGMVALLAPSLAGCGSDNDKVNSQAVCVDQHGTPNDDSDDVRVPDDQCGSGDHDYHGGGGGGGNDALLWYFIGTQAGNNYPPVGSHVTNNIYHGSYTPPPSNVRVVRGGVPATGGKVSSSTVGKGFGGGRASGG